MPEEAGDLAHGTSNRPFAGLLSAAFISVFGTAMSALAIPWLVLSQTGSPGKTGLVSFAELVPYVALQALGGPVVDRVGAGGASLLGITAAFALAALLRVAFIPSGTENTHIDSGTADPARPDSRRGIRGYLEDLSEGL